MKRRQFVAGLVGTTAWPLTARAQHMELPVIGFLRSTSLADASAILTAFQDGLKEQGYIEGQNITIQYRSAENDGNRLSNLVAELIHLPVNVIVGNVVAALAAKEATKTVPIVFASGGDPLRDGIVDNLNRPGGNVTGVSFFAARRRRVLAFFDIRGVPDVVEYVPAWRVGQ